MDHIERVLLDAPEAHALRGHGGAMTYRELDERSGRLAALLRARGDCTDRVVAVIASRGPAQIIGILAVLRAGAAYVPISPELPADRIAWMLADTAPIAVLCDGAPPIAIAAELLVRLDAPLPAARFEPPVVPPSALAYVIYTSGSTGRPKGVMVTRAGFAAQLAWMQRTYRLAPRDRVLQLASALFDFSVIEIFWPMMVGASIILPRPRGELEPRYLAELANAEAATVVHFVPSLLHAVVDACATPWTTIRMVFSGGEALPLDLARAVPAVFPSAELHNQYGPTETTINATHWKCEPGDTSVPIGRAVDDTPLYVLDEQLAPAQTGELWIGGIQVARGYLRRPALTAERFVPDPFTGGRMYRSGDLVRRRDDGVLEYLGRADFQVKVRGFRIELGEIEAELRAHAQVRNAVVVGREDPSRGTVLVAYVSGTADRSALREHLAQRLPEYMIPATFVFLDELPLTATGKIDRKGLPEPNEDHAYAAPRTPTERLLAAVWSELIGVPQVSRDDELFALGGHSLIIVRMVARLYGDAGLEVSLRTVYEHPVLSDLAAVIDAGTQRDDSDERALTARVSAATSDEVARDLATWSRVELGVPRDPDPRAELTARLIAQHRIDANPNRPLAHRVSPTAAVTFAQQLQWDFNRRNNYPFQDALSYAYAIEGPLDVGAMQRAMAALVDRQASLRTTFAADGARVIQTAQDRAFELALVTIANDAQGRERFAELGRQHDLVRGGFRAELLRRGPADHVLVLSAHHAVADGFSWEVLLPDLATLYRGFSRGEPMPAPLAFEFRDFAFWQTTLETRPIGLRQLAYWKAAVDGYEGLALPGDRGDAPRGAVGMALDVFQRGAMPFSITGADWAAVEHACAHTACTPYAVIAAAFFLLLARWSDRADACVLTGNFHRNRPGSEHVIGNFVTPYPLRFRVDEGASIESLLRACQEAVVEHREQGHVAPSSALPAWTEWSRYNLNYRIDMPEAQPDLGGPRVHKLEWQAHPQRTAHDLALFLRQGKAGIRGSFGFNAERFSPELAARAAARLTDLVRILATKPALRVRELPRAP
jgi:amino acid adenylation domain-containing protein